MLRNFTPFSRSSGCRVSDAITYCNFRMVILENDFVRASILPEKGAEIYQLEYKPAGTDVLFKRDKLRFSALLASAQVGSDTGFVDTYAGGWQELFPSGGAACQVNGARIGTHGESFLLPWNWEILEDQSERVVVKFSLRLLRFPFKLTRIMTLERKKAVLELQESIENIGMEPQPYMWGHHPVFGAPFLDETCVLDLPEGVLNVHEGEPASNQRLMPGSRGEWPAVTGRYGNILDLHNIPSQHSRTADMFYLSGFNRGWYALSSRRLGFGVAMQWDAEIFSSLWIWQEFCGSSGYPWYSETYALGLEPFTAFSTQGTGLEEFMRLKKEKWLAPGQKVETNLKMIFYAFLDTNSVNTVSDAGEVKLSF